MRTADRVAYRFRYARIVRAMSMEEAKKVLGFPPDASPSTTEVTRAWRAKAFENHPDRGGDASKMVEINVAKDILEGKTRPSGGGGMSYEEPSTEPVRTRWEPPPDEKVVSFSEAESKGGIPGGVKWLFVTDPHGSGYSSDEFENRASGWVAVGQTDKAWVFTTVEHYRREDYFVGTRRGKTDAWTISTSILPKSGPPTAQLLYGGVMKAWKRFEKLEKRFNSKVTPAEGWTFGEKLPSGRSLSIKNFLANTGMVSEEAGAAPRKYVIQVQYVGLNYDDSRDNPPPDFVKQKYGDPFKLVLIINGKEYTMPGPATEKLSRLRVKGKLFVDWMFGDYHYGGTVKVLTLKREGKEVMGWMAENLDGRMSPWVIDALRAASTQASGGRR